MCDMTVLMKAWRRMKIDWIIATHPYGDRWRHGRKLLHAHAHAGAALKYEAIQLRSARRFVRDLLASEVSSPTDKLSEEAKAVLPQLVRANFALNAVRVICGIDVRDPVKDAHYVDVPETVLSMGNEAGIPGRFFVDFLPICELLPIYVVKESAEKFHSEVHPHMVFRGGVP
jgi:hypothetical protein